MTAEKFRPSFTTSAKAQDEKREARHDYFGSNVTVTPGTQAPTNVRPTPLKFKAVQDALDFDEAQKAQQYEIDKNTRALKAAEKRRKRGHHAS